MKKLILFLLTATVSINCLAQINYEKGYFIDNNNEVTNCLIKNVDWKNNPAKFSYKLSENSEPQEISIESAKEFGVYNFSKYIRSTVNIDRSDDRADNLSEFKDPMFKKETLYLKALVEGKANLYQYVDGNLERFFYSVGDEKLKQLVYKKYVNDEDKIGENDFFKMQLWNDLKCSDYSNSEVGRLDYKKKDLIDLFKTYNSCGNNNERVKVYKNEHEDLFNLTVRPRINSSSLTIENSTGNSLDNEFDNEIGFGIGLEAEFILPFNQNKWAITLEPTYNTYQSEKTISLINTSEQTLQADVDYKSIEIPVGLRYYFFLNDNAAIFANIAYVYNFATDSKIDFIREDGSVLNSLDPETKANIAMGIGVKLNNTFSVEARYQTDRELLHDYAYWTSDYKSFSVILGYTLF